MASVNDYDGFVGLNVGGKIYWTACATLTRYPDSFFSRLLEGSVPSAKDGQGNYLIDRDGEIFRHVLNYMRCGELMLPETYVEFGLLEREADFFLLQELKQMITELFLKSDAIGLMFDNGKLFTTTKETLSREEDSFFTRMLSGDVPVSKDALGNYLMDRDGSQFHHIMQYMRDGGIFSTVGADELDYLAKEAEHFGLSTFAKHVESVRFMRERSDGTTPYLHLYHNAHSTCVAYTASVKTVGESSTPGVPKAVSSIMCKPYAISEGVFSGVVDLKSIKPEGSVSALDLISHFKAQVQFC